MSLNEPRKPAAQCPGQELSFIGLGSFYPQQSCWRYELEKRRRGGHIPCLGSEKAREGRWSVKHQARVDLYTLRPTTKARIVQGPFGCK